MAGKAMQFAALTALLVVVGIPGLCSADENKDTNKRLTVQLEGAEVELARWQGDRTCAISLCFHGNHPSHITKVIPLLDKRKYAGTFFISPESAEYKAHQQDWEKAIVAGKHQFVTDTAPGVEAAASQTFIVGTDPNVAQITDLATFQQEVDETLADRSWTCFKFHAIGEGSGLGVSQQLFEDMLKHMGTRRFRGGDLWVGGISAVGEYQTERDAAGISAQLVKPYTIDIAVDCGTDPEVHNRPLTIFVKPGRDWPYYDLVFVDGKGTPLTVMRYSSGFHWSELLVQVPPVDGSYQVRIAPSEQHREGDFRRMPSLRVSRKPLAPTEAIVTAQDETTGLSAEICRWYGGSKAAVSLQFDGAYDSQLLQMMPLMQDEYNVRGTFVITTRAQSGELRDKWVAACREAFHELGIYQCSRSRSDEALDIWLDNLASFIRESRQPGKSGLVALANGGGQLLWLTKSWAYFLEKHDLWEQFWMCSMAECYNKDGTMVQRYAQNLDGAIKSGIWFTAHFHGIGDTSLNITEPTFRGALQAVKERVASGQMWNAGMTDIYQYQQERLAAKLALKGGKPDAATLSISCETDAELFKQPLTIELALPEGWSAEALKVRGGNGNTVATQAAAVDDRPVVRLDVAPVDGEYSISRQ